MDKSKVLQALQKVKAESTKRNFTQTVDFIINLKDIDLKKSESKLDSYVQLHNPMGKKMKICALVGAELKAEAEQVADKTIISDDFETYAKDKKLTKKLAAEFDYFVGQANLMPKIAGAFGRVLGSRGKMPNPKAGCIVPPNANLKPLVEKLQKTVHVKAKTSPVIHTIVGKEDMDENQVTDNILTIYNAVVHQLPNAQHNIKSAYVKLTMGKPIQVPR